jgi:hypothetical protein
MVVLGLALLVASLVFSFVTLSLLAMAIALVLLGVLARRALSKFNRSAGSPP